MEPEEFKTVVVPMLEAIYESHGRVGPSDTVAGLWFGALRRFNAQVVEQALTQYVGRANPTYSIVQPNDIVLLIEGSPEDRAGAAWHKFYSAVRSQSPYLSIVFDDPYIHATVQHMGGWVKVTQELEESAREQFRKLFEHHYKLFLLTGLPEDTPLRLTGVVENHRIPNGLQYEERIQLVGDRAVAKLVGSGGHPALPLRRTASEQRSSVHGDAGRS